MPNADGKRPVFFRARKGSDVRPIKLPCGQCVGCRLEKSRQWAIRCVHESELYEQNCYITLTYRKEDVPTIGGRPTLVKSDFQKFMKRLSISRVRANLPAPRFYYCGEYGEDDVNHPHYHAILFGIDFEDKYPWKENQSGDVIYRSPLLESFWTHGFSSVGAVTFKSAAYVARYVMKKQTGKAAIFYEHVDADGVVHQVQPPYTDMSRGGRGKLGGIGYRWFERFKADVYPDDFIVVNGKKIRPPRYYDQLLARLDADDLEDMKFKRHLSGQAHSENNSRDRLRVREQVQIAKLKLLKRGNLDDH